MALRYAGDAASAECRESHEACGLARFWYVKLLIKARDLDTGRRVLDAVEVRGKGPEAQRMTATSRVVRGELLFATGKIESAMTEIDAGLRVAERSGAESLRPPGYVVLALGALRRADMRSCLDFVDKLGNEALLGYFGHAAGAWVTAQAMEARSGVSSAAGLVTGIVRNPRVLDQLLVSDPAGAPWLVRASGKLDAPDLAHASATAAAAVSVNHPRFSVIQASALHASGLLEKDSGKLHEAAHLSPDPWCQASAREDMADLLTRRRSERDTAVATLESVVDTYTEVGATRDASRVVNKLRELGVRRVAVRSVEREGVSPHGLTNTEFAVAELVSQGHTNNEVGRQLFISQHTVAFHLKKVFQKMNIASRVELAATWKAMR